MGRTNAGVCYTTAALFRLNIKPFKAERYTAVGSEVFCVIHPVSLRPPFKALSITKNNIAPMLTKWNVSMKHWWDDNDRERSKYSDRN